MIQINDSVLIWKIDGVSILNIDGALCTHSILGFPIAKYARASNLYLEILPLSFVLSLFCTSSNKHCSKSEICQHQQYWDIRLHDPSCWPSSDNTSIGPGIGTFEQIWPSFATNSTDKHLQGRIDTWILLTSLSAKLDHFHDMIWSPSQCFDTASMGLV